MAGPRRGGALFCPCSFATHALIVPESKLEEASCICIPCLNGWELDPRYRTREMRASQIITRKPLSLWSGNRDSCRSFPLQGISGPSCWFKVVVRGAASAAVQLRVCISCELLLHMSDDDKHCTPLGMSSDVLIKCTVGQLGTYYGYAVKASGNDLVFCAQTGFAKILHYQRSLASAMLIYDPWIQSHGEDAITKL